jgi:tetratricopeptide (TPR) repeat protein
MPAGNTKESFTAANQLQAAGKLQVQQLHGSNINQEVQQAESKRECDSRENKDNCADEVAEADSDTIVAHALPADSNTARAGNIMLGRCGSGSCQPASYTEVSSSRRSTASCGSHLATAALAGSSLSQSKVLEQAAKLEARSQQLTLSGKIVEATATLKSAAALLSQHLGASHPTSIAGLTRLAVHLNRHGSSNEAEQLLRQVLTHKQAMLGKRHPQVATAKSNLAACLYAQGNYAAAAKMYSSALAVKQSALGENHPDSAQLLHNLALCNSR